MTPQMPAVGTTYGTVVALTRVALSASALDISAVARLANTATVISMESKIVKEDLKEAVSSILAAAAAADASEWRRVEKNLAEAVSRCSRVIDELARERGPSGQGREGET